MTRDTNDCVKDYNDDVAEYHFKSVTMGSMKRPRATLLDLVGEEVYDHSNDNEKQGE